MKIRLWLAVAIGLLTAFGAAAAPAKTLLGGVMNKGKCESCAMSLKNMAPLFGMYADAHRGVYPPLDNLAGLKELMAFGSIPLRCPGRVHEEPQPAANQLKETDSDYIYIGGMSCFLQKPAEIPFVFDKPGNNHVNVLFGDGHVETINAKDSFKNCAEVIAALNKLKKYDQGTLRFLTDKANAIDLALGYVKAEEVKNQEKTK